MKKLIMIVMIAGAMLCPCNGYIDPGTGGLLLTNAWTVITGIIGAIAAVIAAYLITPLKKLIKRLLKRNEKKQK